jgi:hypothetical protein
MSNAPQGISRIGGGQQITKEDMVTGGSFKSSLRDSALEIITKASDDAVARNGAIERQRYTYIHIYDGLREKYMKITRDYYLV